MKNLLCLLALIVGIICLAPLTSATFEDDGYSNGSDVYTYGDVEYYINVEDEDRLYAINLSTMTEHKVLDSHIISMLDGGEWIYLLVYENSASKLVKFQCRLVKRTHLKKPKLSLD